MTGAGSETELVGTFTVVVHERDRVNSERVLADARADALLRSYA